MQSVELEPVKRGFNEIVIIYPQMLSGAEMDEFSFREVEISPTDEKKSEKTYQLRLDFLIAVSFKPPMKQLKGSKELVPLVEGQDDAESSLREYFKTQSPVNEKVLEWLYLDVCRAFIPKPDF